MVRCGAAVDGTHRLGHICSHTKVISIETELQRSHFRMCPASTNIRLIRIFVGGGAVTSHALDYINDEFIVTADSSKPLIHIWPVNSQEKLQGSIVASGKVTALAVSPDGNYMVLAVGPTIFVRQICTGMMTAVPQRHYQAVTALKFIDDGGHFISAGHDGYLFAWKLTDILINQGEDAVPIHNEDNFSQHALPITDIHVGTGGMRSIVVSVSLDRACKIHDLASGTLLLNLVFPEPLTAVTVDALEANVYVGTADGSIFEFSLQSPPRAKEYHVASEALTAQNRFVGHKGAIKSLSLSLDGESLLSGGADECVKLWHISSKQLIRNIPHKGAITNARFVLTPKPMFDQEIKLNLIANKYKKSDDHVVEVMVTEPISTEPDDLLHKFDANRNATVGASAGTSNGQAVASNGNVNELEELRTEIKRLQKINKQLFEHSMTKILGRK